MKIEELLNILIIFIIGLAIIIIMTVKMASNNKINKINNQLDRIEAQLDEINMYINEMQEAIDELQGFHKESEDNE